MKAPLAFALTLTLLAPACIAAPSAPDALRQEIATRGAKQVVDDLYNSGGGGGTP